MAYIPDSEFVDVTVCSKQDTWHCIPACRYFCT